MKSLKIGIVGATGVVGQEIINCLYSYGFKNSQLTLMASARSAGKQVQSPFGNHTIQEFSVDLCKDLDLIFLCAGGDFSKQHAKTLAKNSVVIDSSSAFRYDESVPIIIPQVNPSDAASSNLIAKPNCSTAILVMALWPLYQKYGLKYTIVSTYQSVSGAGKDAMDDLEDQTKQLATGKKLSANHFPVPIAQNLIPRIDDMQDNGYSKEEMKVTWETRKLFHDTELLISCTAVRVPTMRAHAEAVTFVAEHPIDLDEVRKLLASSPGLKLVDDPEHYELPMPLNTSGQYDVAVGRLRHNIVFGKNSLDFFICGDNLLRGAALNAVEVAKVRFGGKV